MDVLLAEFSDVSPLEVEEVENGICSISYTPLCRHCCEEGYFIVKTCLGYLKSSLQTCEISNRVFRLTGEIITMNASYITAWVIRQKCIVKLGVNWSDEFQFLETIRQINEKCYQTWMHRKFVVEHSGDYSHEKDYCDSYIVLDNKNIHSWTYRYWVVQQFDLWDGELEYSQKYIDIDIFNNSAWSYRFYIFKHLNKGVEHLEIELDYAMGCLEKAPHNEAAWNYLKGLMKNYKSYCYDDVIFAVNKIVKIYPDVISGYHLLLSYYRELFEVEKLDMAIEFAKKLQEVDWLRKLYWSEVEKELEKDRILLQQI